MAGQENLKPAGLEKRAVVSSFIFHFPNGPSCKPVVALFKRSGDVRTYRHHMAPIAGSISRKDKDPLAAAWREISEETQLNPSTLKFWRTGVPFTFSDESVGREWTVNPFGYILKSPEEGGKGVSAIKTDWEHEGWQWYDPTTVMNDENLIGVPHLKESLRRVWFEGNMDDGTAGVLARGLDRLQNDHESGARELTAIAVGIFRDFISQLQGDMGSKWWDTVCMGAWHLVKNGRESMGAATLNALLAILKDIEANLGGAINREQKLGHIISIIDSHLENRRANAARLHDVFASYVQSNFLPPNDTRDKLTILTLSSSSTIRDSILDAYGSLDIRTLNLRILESRPLFEGVSLASSIRAKFHTQFHAVPNRNLHIDLYTDASAAFAAKDVDIVLLGADQISATKGVSNKIGSLPLVLGAKHVCPTVKVVVLSDLEKLNGESGLIDDETHEGNDPREVISSWQNGRVRGVEDVEADITKKEDNLGRRTSVEVNNIYFEWVPKSMVDAFVSGEGILDDQRLREQSIQQGELADQYFYSLPILY